MYKYLILALFFLLCTFFTIQPRALFAQEAVATDPFPGEEAPAELDNSDSIPKIKTNFPSVPKTLGSMQSKKTVKDTMAAHQGGFSFERYVDPTVYNLAHLYWTLGMLDLNNNDHIDNFLLVTECNMFQTYVTNDLEWAEIRENTRNFLRENYRYFPTYFKISIPLYLRNYDTKLERFDVDQAKSAVDNARRIDTIYNTALTVCGKSGEIEGYPKNLILLLNRPFNLPYVPVEMELARLFLDERNSQQIRHSLTTATTKEAHERLAVLELMIRVHTYRETMTTVSGLLKAAVFAQIDYIRVFADIGKEKLLYEQDMFENQNRSVKRKSGPVVIDGKNMPQGPLFGTIVEDEEE